jgi:hypothetical protein
MSLALHARPCASVAQVNILKRPLSAAEQRELRQRKRVLLGPDAFTAAGSTGEEGDGVGEET